MDEEHIALRGEQMHGVSKKVDKISMVKGSDQKERNWANLIGARTPGYEDRVRQRTWKSVTKGKKGGSRTY